MEVAVDVRKVGEKETVSVGLQSAEHEKMNKDGAIGSKATAEDRD